MNREPEHPDRLHGVYVIRHADTDEVLYVGMSNNPSNRIYLHHLALKAYWCFEPYTVAVHSAPNRTEAKRLERRLIEALCPRDNKHFRRVGMDVAPQRIDLPHAYTLDEFNDLMHEDDLRARAESPAPPEPPAVRVPRRAAGTDPRQAGAPATGPTAPGLTNRGAIMPDQTTLTGDMARVAADLLDELALVGAVPYGAHVYRNHVSLTYLEAAVRRAGADALGLRGTAWRYGSVDQSGFVATDHGSLGEVEVIVSSSPDAEDLRRERENAETAARAAAAVTP